MWRIEALEYVEYTEASFRNSHVFFGIFLPAIFNPGLP